MQRTQGTRINERRSKAEKECFEEKKRRKRRRRIGGGGRRRLPWWPASIQDGARSRVRAEEEKNESKGRGCAPSGFEERRRKERQGILRFCP